MGAKYTSINDIYKLFDDAQIDYINSTPENERLPQPELNIHFNQLQAPVSHIVFSESKTPIEELFEDKHLESAKEKNTLNDKKYKGYPKRYPDPTDEEYEEKNGKYYYYFNITKTLRIHNLIFIEKIIPKGKLEKWTYNRPFLDKYAQRQHKKVVALNEMSAREQFWHDIKVRMIKAGIIVSVALVSFLYVKYSAIPSYRFEKASTLMNSEDYENAYYLYNGLGNYNQSFVYAKYCEGQMCLRVGKFDQAKDCFIKLEDYQEYFSEDIDMTQMEHESDYLKAIDMYNQRMFNDAKILFKSIYKYSNSTEYYYKCCYQQAMESYDNGDIYAAIDDLYEAGSADYADSHDMLIKLADEIYNKALSAYNEKDYESALNDFSFLKSYRYKDSEDMYTQCSYSQALDCFNNGEYKEAASDFDRIKDYKDSISLNHECVYRIGKQAYSLNPASSILKYETITGYKDVNSILCSNRLSLYGKWNIIEQNGSTIEPIEFTYTDNDEFFTDTPLSGVAISTEAMPYKYKWSEDHFEALDGEYKMTVTAQDNKLNKEYLINCVLLECTNGSNTYTYLCERTMTYSDMINLSDETDEEYADMSLNEIISEQIKKYIDKKIDAIVEKDGEEISLITETQKLQSTMTDTSDSKGIERDENDETD